jgi:hypothetical protein
VGTATKTFTYSGMGETIARTVEGSNTLTYIHTLGGGSPLAQKKGSAIRWYLRDTHGDVVGLITPTGGNQGTVAFDPWGTKLGVTGTETSAFGYQGDPPPPWIADPPTRVVNGGTGGWRKAALRLAKSGITTRRKAVARVPWLTRGTGPDWSIA